MEPTRVEVFGANSTESATELGISKTDLTGVGLIAAGGNTAESLFVAMLLKAKAKLNDTNRDTDSDIQIVIGDPSESLLTQSSIRYKVTSYTIELYKLEPATALNPMDF